MKSQNKKSDKDFFSLTEVDLKTFIYQVNDSVSGLLVNTKKCIEDYVLLHNEYIGVKLREEKAKTKKLK